MKPAIALTAVPIGAAVAVNLISLAALEGRLFPELDGAQILIRVSPAAALLVALSVAWRHAKTEAPPGQPTLLLVLVALYPPS